MASRGGSLDYVFDLALEVGLVGVHGGFCDPHLWNPGSATAAHTLDSNLTVGGALARPKTRPPNDFVLHVTLNSLGTSPPTTNSRSIAGLESEPNGSRPNFPYFITYKDSITIIVEGDTTIVENSYQVGNLFNRKKWELNTLGPTHQPKRGLSHSPALHMDVRTIKYNMRIVL